MGAVDPNGAGPLVIPSGLPSGGTNGQVVTKVAGVAAWADAASGLPTASGADQFPASTGAGTTYTARTAAQVRAALGISSSGPVLTPLGALAAGITVHAAIAPSIFDVTTGFVELNPPRTLQVLMAGGGSVAAYYVDGTDISGNAISGIVVSTPGYADVLVGGVRVAYATVTRWRADGNGGAAVTLVTGPGFAVPPWTTFRRVSVDGVGETPTSTNAATGTVVPASAPNGTRVYAVLAVP